MLHYIFWYAYWITRCYVKYFSVWHDKVTLISSFQMKIDFIKSIQFLLFILTSRYLKSCLKDIPSASRYDLFSSFLLKTFIKSYLLLIYLMYLPIIIRVDILFVTSCFESPGSKNVIKKYNIKIHYLNLYAIEKLFFSLISILYNDKERQKSSTFYPKWMASTSSRIQVHLNIILIERI